VAAEDAAAELLAGLPGAAAGLAMAGVDMWMDDEEEDDDDDDDEEEEEEDVITDEDDDEGGIEEGGMVYLGEVDDSDMDTTDAEDDDGLLAGLGVADAPVEAAAAAAAQEEPPAAREAAAAAAAAGASPAGTAAAGAGAAASPLPQHPAQHLLLVGTKVLGDVNVPAGRVSFAFDVSSRSLEGAGQLLQLPAEVTTRVDVNKPGVRQLRVQVSLTRLRWEMMHARDIDVARSACVLVCFALLGLC
jgi:hypothetical protein